MYITSLSVVGLLPRPISPHTGFSTVSPGVEPVDCSTPAGMTLHVYERRLVLQPADS